MFNIFIDRSASWPPFRLAAARLRDIRKKFEKEVDFLSVYIREAHAQDEWKQGYLTNTKQHKSLTERFRNSCFSKRSGFLTNISLLKKYRLSAAVLFQKEFEWDIPLLVDNMDNGFNTVFAG